VGGLLTYPDGSIQHGGHTFVSKWPTHVGWGEGLDNPMSLDLVVDHEVVGVTGALMFQLKANWKAVGGFAQSFPLNFNDVDYCQKIRTLGYSVVQANSVTAVHLESATRNPIVKDWEKDRLSARWGFEMSSDRYSKPYQ
jgi:GT2 family glycosyltransferase